MEYRYRTNLKKVFLTDQELVHLNDRISQSGCKTFSEYARKSLLNPDMNFLKIDTSSYQELVFELRRIGNNINQIDRFVNQTNLISMQQLELLRLGIAELIMEVEKDFVIKVEKLRHFHGHH